MDHYSRCKQLWAWHWCVGLLFEKRKKTKLKQGLSENSTDLTLRTILNHISLVKIFILLCFLRKNLSDSNKKIEIVPHLLMYLLHLLTQLSSSCLQLSLQHLDFLVLDC